MHANRKLLNIELGRANAEDYTSLPESGLVVVLDNVRSAYNTGSIFRTCDCFKVDLAVLCGITAVPPSTEIHKTALGAEAIVPHIHFDNTLEAVRELRKQGFTIVSVEQTSASRKLGEFTPDPSAKYALVFGNEVDGVSQGVVDESDFSIEIPQYGTKHSFNVSVSAGIVLWAFHRER